MANQRGSRRPLGWWDWKEGMVQPGAEMASGHLIAPWQYLVGSEATMGIS